jgi:hypothetical protein
LQHIDDIISELILVENQTVYCEYKNSKASQLQMKLDIAREKLNRVLEERQYAEEVFAESRQQALAQLQEQQERELQDHDAEYSGDLPVKFRHVSGDVLQIRERERYLRHCRRYLEAQQLMEEADAIEAFELERQRVRWYNEGVVARNGIMDLHRRQIDCLQEKKDREWIAMVPGSVAREAHLRAVITHLEDKLRREEAASKEARETTKEILRKEPGLPSLGRKVPPSPLRQVTTTNVSRTYTQAGIRRARSSVK